MASLELIERALRNAHKAGDTDAARRLARAYQATRQQLVQPGDQRAERIKQLEAEIEQLKTYNPADSMSDTERFVAGAGMGAANLVKGAGQRLRGVLPEQWSNSLGLPTAADVAANRKIDSHLKDTTAGSLGNLTGEIAATAILPGGTWAQAAKSGAAIGAFQPTTENESAMQNALTGAAGGALGHGVISGAGRLLRPVRSELSAAEQALARKAQAMGIDLNAAQLTNSKPMRWINSVMDDLPLTAGAQQTTKEAQRKQFNAAVAKTMGTNADNLNEGVMSETKQRVGRAIGDIASRNRFNLDDVTLNRLAQHSHNAQRFEAGDVGKVVNNYIDDFLTKVNRGGKVSGEAYRKFDSELGRRMRGTTNGDLKHALGQIRDTLREGMDKSISPQDAAAWAQLRKQYANMKKIEPLAAKSVDGNISPAGLLGAAIRKDGNAAYRSSELKDLGKIGKAFIQEPASSGTSQRSFYTQMLTNPASIISGGAGFLVGGPHGAAIGGLLPSMLTSGAAAVPLQKLMNSKTGKKYLTEGLLKSIQQLEAPAQRYLAAPVGANGLLGAYN